MFETFVLIPCFGSFEFGSFDIIPLVIIMFRKYDGGIRVCSRKTVLNQNVFLTTPIFRISIFVLRI